MIRRGFLASLSLIPFVKLPEPEFRLGKHATEVLAEAERFFLSKESIWIIGRYWSQESFFDGKSSIMINYSCYQKQPGLFCCYGIYYNSCSEEIIFSVSDWHFNLFKPEFNHGTVKTSQKISIEEMRYIGKYLYETYAEKDDV